MSAIELVATPLIMTMLPTAVISCFAFQQQDGERDVDIDAPPLRAVDITAMRMDPTSPRHHHHIATTSSGRQGFEVISAGFSTSGSGMSSSVAAWSRESRRSSSNNTPLIPFQSYPLDSDEENSIATCTSDITM